MGAKHSSIYSKTQEFKPTSKDLLEEEDSLVSTPSAPPDPKIVSRVQSKELAQAVAEANERLFLENAKRARHSLSVRSLFSTATTTCLSERQKTIIKQTWKLAIADGKLKPGISIFQNIFRRCPDLKDVFRLGHIHDLDELPKEERFLRHANVFSDVIDLAVRNMEELDVQMAPALITLGRRHYYKHNVGFRPDYLAVFAQAMLDFVTERLQISDKEAIDGWWLITVYLVTKLQHGYALESMGKNHGRFHNLWRSKT